MNKKKRNHCGLLLIVSYSVMMLIHGPLFICYGIWYLNFYNHTFDKLPGNIKFSNDMFSTSMVILSCLNAILYPLMIVTIKSHEFDFLDQ